ncbi:hypothetical protein SAMN06265222_105269 [Neorhodopirellula lusitana]|uniref:Uncharacterized protein n=1 Tax=Neorhodopirellula lusitana TaxID=445327 RepID=A0ABY1Q2D5_9BACT|nr:hypothetical protein [Neorhodopirellula lusitana]SMP57159.1 hypothetical protein SAMN06265222_105269 [Neorhodopirellula lusitana]
MSSNRFAGPSEAVVTRDDQMVGAMLLPQRDGQSFVEEFNRTYRSIGLSVEIYEPSQPGPVKILSSLSDAPALHSQAATPYTDSLDS